MIAITGASGKLGQLVIQELLSRGVPPSQIAALVRTPAKAGKLAALGVELRVADYAQPETLATALKGAEKILLISSNEFEQRIAHHDAVIAAAAAQPGPPRLVYTSILKADSTGLILAADHKATEQHLIASGLPYTILRNGWYYENHTENLGAALRHGAIIGAAGDGRFASASRADLAAAAAVVLTTEGHTNKVYELAGDHPYTLTELAAEVSKQSGKPVVYTNLPEAAYAKALESFGFPPDVAEALAESDTGAAHGALDSSSRDLQTLLGRPATTLAEAVRVAIQDRHMVN